MKRSVLVWLFLLLLVLFALPCAAEESESGGMPEPQIVYSRIIDVPGVGEWPYYAQNDPLWDNSIYEPHKSKLWRPFREGGCGPTAAAIAVSRHLQGEDLMMLLDYLNPYQDGLTYCSCSINGYRCDRTHEKSVAHTQEEFETYLPVLFGAFATGNNAKRVKYRSEAAGTQLNFFPTIAEAYNLEYHNSREWEDAYEALQNGYSIISTVGDGVFTDESHYLVLAYADKEYLYILDPFMREDYSEYDKRGVIEIIEPGLVKVSMENFSRLGLSGYYMFGPQMDQQDASAKGEP